MRTDALHGPIDKVERLGDPVKRHSLDAVQVRLHQHAGIGAVQALDEDLVELIVAVHDAAFVYVKLEGDDVGQGSTSTSSGSSRLIRATCFL